ncbi:MAG: hypothetical protein ABJC10_14320 [Acidobacteriota bacterium]
MQYQAALLLLGDEIVVFLYGSKWATAGTILRILALLSRLLVSGFRR